MIKVNNQVVGTNTKASNLTQSAYDALSSSEKNNGTAYMVTSSEEQIQKLLFALGVIGNQNALANIADGTLAGAIEDIYNKLGGCEFTLESINGVLTVSHDDNPSPSGNTPVDIDSLSDDDAKINALVTLLGDKSVLEATGNGTIVDAILDIYERLNGFSFEVDTTGEEPVLAVTRVI